MNKNKLFVLISLLTLLSLFLTSATCNLCTIAKNKVIDIEDSQLTIDSTEETTQVTAAVTPGNTTATIADETIEGEPLEAPAISIFIYEGYKYSAEDGICYYRIASEVYGNPYPKVTWSKDDSNGALGWDKVQVNLSRGQTYKLTATATNSVDTATASLTLTWGCDDSQVSENTQAENTQESQESEVQVMTVNLSPVYMEGRTRSSDKPLQNFETFKKINKKAKFQFLCFFIIILI